MHGLRLALRALWWRRGLSATILFVAVIAMTTAVLGPLYARASEQSSLHDRLRTARPATSGLTAWLARADHPSTAGQLTVEQARTVVNRALVNPGLDKYYDKPIASLESSVPGGLGFLLPGSVTGLDIARGPIRVRPEDIDYTAVVIWRQGICKHLTFDSGRCPTTDDQVAISARAAKTAKVKVGDTIGIVTTSANGKTATPRIVGGIYRADATDPYWFDDTPYRGQSYPDPNKAPQLDVVVATEHYVASTEIVRASADRAVRPYAIGLDDMGRIEATIGDVRNSLASQTKSALIDTKIDRVFHDARSDRRVIDLTVLLVALQLVLLTWFVLFLVVATATEQRSGEVALAKLRGLRPSSAVAFGLAEPVLLLTLSIPVGFVVALLGSTAMIESVLLPHTPVEAFRLPVLAAIGVAFLGGLVAAFIAARATLTRPVLDQLRRTSGSGRNGARSLAVEAVVLVLAAVGVWQVQSGGAELASGKSNMLALLTPGLLAMGVAVVALRLLPFYAWLRIRRTRGSGQVAGFLASRQLGRRPGALRVVVLLTVAVALATFAVDAWRVAADNRENRASQETGAGQVLTVTGGSTRELLYTVRRLDPSGKHAMAASEYLPYSGPNDTGHVVAVDATRLAAVSAWHRNWSPSPAATLARKLHPVIRQPVVLRGDTLTATVDVQKLEKPPGDVAGSGASGPATMTVLVTVQTPDGRQVGVSLGTTQPGEHAYSGPAPECRSGCRVVSIGLDRDPGDLDTITGTVVWKSLGTDGRDQGGTSGDKAGLWRPMLQAQVDPSRPPETTVSGSGGGLTIRFTVDASDVPFVSPGDLPETLPAVVTTKTDTTPYAGTPGAIYGTGLDGQSQVVTPIERASSLPRVDRAGELVDLEYADRMATADFRDTLDEVWLSPDAPSSFGRRLEAAGFHISDRSDLSARLHQLDRQGPALGLLLFLVAAVAAVVLAVAGVVTNSYLSGRRRAYELAAMRTFGVSRHTLVRAGGSEQRLLWGGSVVLGAVTGLVAAGLALPAVPFYSDEGAGPPLDYTPRWLLLGGLFVALLVLIGVLSALISRLLVRTGVPELLREAQA
ncbi:MAG: FtsX-like permease family protein [Mycobacteriales bacterium]